MALHRIAYEAERERRKIAEFVMSPAHAMRLAVYFRETQRYPDYSGITTDILLFRDLPVFISNDFSIKPLYAFSDAGRMQYETNKLT